MNLKMRMVNSRKAQMMTVIVSSRQSKGVTSDESEEDGVEESMESVTNIHDRGPPAKRRRKVQGSNSDKIINRFSIGTELKKFFEGDGWIPGNIASVDEDCYNKSRYQDGDEETYLILEELSELEKIVAR